MEPILDAEAELLRVFQSPESKQEAHAGARRVMGQLASDPSFLTAALARHVSEPANLAKKNYPVVGVPIALNPWFSLIANCWIPLPNGDTTMSTKAIHHHGHMLLTIATALGPGYEHWMFSMPAALEEGGDTFGMDLIEAAPHPLQWDIRSGRWSEPELELLGPGLRAGETALDIGANYGLYAYHMSKAVGASGKVYSFEPIPFTARTFRLIQRGLGFGANVELIPKGCGGRASRMTFHVPVENGAISAGQVHMGRNDDRAGDAGKYHATKKVECDVVALDEFLPAGRDGALIKCDIDGADLFAMRGARRIIEITPWLREGFGLAAADLTSFTAERGYDLYRYEGGALHRANARDIVEDNWVFLHPSRRDRFAKMIRERKGVESVGASA
jgi:FkbM family methyltransferase